MGENVAQKRSSRILMECKYMRIPPASNLFEYYKKLQEQMTQKALCFYYHHSIEYNDFTRAQKPNTTFFHRVRRRAQK